MNSIKIGDAVKLLLWRDKKVHNFIITDVYLEAYINGWKPIIKAKYYCGDKAGDYWSSETFFLNDFLEAYELALKHDKY